MWLKWRPQVVQLNQCQRFGEENPLIGFSAERPRLDARQLRMQNLKTNAFSILGKC